MKKLTFKNPNDDKQIVADFNLAIFEKLCDAAKALALNYSDSVDKISSKVLVFGEDYSGIPEGNAVKGVSD